MTNNTATAMIAAKPLSACLADLRRGYADGLALIQRARCPEYRRRVAVGLAAAEARTGSSRPKAKPSRRWHEAKPDLHTLGFLAALMGEAS